MSNNTETITQEEKLEKYQELLAKIIEDGRKNLGKVITVGRVAGSSPAVRTNNQ